MNDHEMLAQHFETHRAYLRTVAYRILGSADAAEDALQETQLRLTHGDGGAAGNVPAWLTNLVTRICLDMLRARGGDRHAISDRTTDRTTDRAPAAPAGPMAAIAESATLALLVALDRLTPAERLAFVLHELLALPYDEVALAIGRSPEDARRLAERARRRVQNGGRGEPAAVDLAPRPADGHPS